MNENRSSLLFLMEMILVLGFFMICASICISVFAGANTMSHNAQDNNRGLLFAESIAEIIKEDGVENLDKYWENTEKTNDSYELFDGDYKGIVEVKYENNMQLSDISIYRQDKKIYSLDIKLYKRP